MRSQAPWGARQSPPAIRAIFAAWAFSAAVACLVVTIYAAGDHRRIELSAAELEVIRPNPLLGYAIAEQGNRALRDIRHELALAR